MALRDLGPADDAALRRDRFLALAEGRMADAAGAALRAFLRDVLATVTPSALTAATGDVPTSLRLFTLGEAMGWWDDAIDQHVAGEVRRAWRAGYFDTRDGDLLLSNQKALDDYLANVTDRLSRTATPTIPERAFDTARVALADEIARSAPIDEMALRLAQEFSWDADATYARRRLADLDNQVDRILDAIGPPGDPVREATRLGDPQIRDLQRARTEQVRQIDRTRSEWQTRAERIARTETAGAYNAGAIDAGFAEGQKVKVWMATGDERTRDSHLSASGQCVPMTDRFSVGGESLVMPGDPAASAGEIVNCRCTVVFADSCEDAAGRYRLSREVVDAQRRERGLEVPVGADRPASPKVSGPSLGVPDDFSDDALNDSLSRNSQTVDGRIVVNPHRRITLHDPYVERQMAYGVRVDEPEFRVMGGGPASGKSTIIQTGDVRLPRGHVMANADEAKDAIPEYRGGLARNDPRAAAYVHEESSLMAKRLAAESLDAGYPTVLDGTGNGSAASLTAKIASARENGARRIVGDYVTVDTEEAVRRAVIRAAETGRHVPEGMMRRTHAAVSDTFREIAGRGLFDELRLWDTNGSTPRLIYENVAGTERILDAAAYESFLRKGTGYGG